MSTTPCAKRRATAVRRYWAHDPGRISLKNERLHRWLTLGANFGVLIGIVLVAAELNQNLTSVQAQTRHEISTGIVEFMQILAQDGELANIRRRGDAGEQLNEDEAYRYGAFTRGIFRYWENVHYQVRHGLYEADEFERQKEAWRAHAGASPGVVEWFCSNRTHFAEEFAAEYTALLPGQSC